MLKFEELELEIDDENEGAMVLDKSGTELTVDVGRIDVDVPVLLKLVVPIIVLKTLVDIDL